MIIDYQQAIENGFVRMTQRMVAIMHSGEEEWCIADEPG